jgi:uncharacterized membrane protein HdeD (DUF308 family)
MPVRNEASKNAGVWLVLQGTPSALFGVLVLLWPGTVLPALTALLAAHALIEGARTALDRAPRPSRRSAWARSGALSSPAAGALALLWPGPAALALPLVTGAWTLLLGTAALLRRMRTWPWRIGAGLMATAALLCLAVLLGGLGVLRLSAAYAIASGLLLSFWRARLLRGLWR